MNSYSFSHVGDETLRRELPAAASRERADLALVVAQIAEYEVRKLYLRDGYSSMADYCVRELRMTEATALKRIRVARLSREFPAILPALAEGRLHPSSVIQLSAHLTSENADELVAAASGKSAFEIAELLVRRTSRKDLIAAGGPLSGNQLSARRVEPDQVSARRVGHGRETPVAEDVYAVHFMWGRGAHEKLRRACDILSHSVPSGAIGAVIERALDLLIARAEKRKFAATAKPRGGRRRAPSNPRSIPAAVRRQVRERDGDRCTFVSETGHRCESRRLLQFDHILEVAKGGQSTADNVRLLCRAHNQYSAERTFGPGFMEKKREDARRAAAEKRAAAEAKRAEEQKRAAADADVIAGLRSVGYRLNEARAAAAFSADLAGGPLETRFKKALSFFRPRARSFDANGVEKVWGSAG